MKPNLSSLLYLAARITSDERAEHEALSFGIYDPQEFAMRLFRKQGPAHLFLDGGDLPYYAAGFEISSPHVATAWSVSTDETQAHVLEMTRVSRKVIKALLAGDVHRIQMTCLANQIGRASCRERV